MIKSHFSKVNIRWEWRIRRYMAPDVLVQLFRCLDSFLFCWFLGWYCVNILYKTVNDLFGLEEKLASWQNRGVNKAQFYLLLYLIAIRIEPFHSQPLTMFSVVIAFKTDKMIRQPSTSFAVFICFCRHSVSFIQFASLLSLDRCWFVHLVWYCHCLSVFLCCFHWHLVVSFSNYPFCLFFLMLSFIHVVFCSPKVQIC